eukprot:TRINITY_DN4113_c0_g1_i4.p1 TRINITY_DN4113_c0_g1~~TRINITY_DN4113_c0_g1_i4.p1  ORF type:complete len:409 (+),score=83.10 TRINITY_DN4113_c0_g1_i4:44-1270(+)
MLMDRLSVATTWGYTQIAASNICNAPCSYLQHRVQYNSLNVWRFCQVMAVSGDRTSVSSRKRNSEKEKDKKSDKNRNVDIEIEKGYKMITVCDKLIDVFLTEKPEPNEWKRLMSYRDEWKKIKNHFHRRCRVRAIAEKDDLNKKKLLALSSKVKEIDAQMQRYDTLLKEVKENPSEVTAIVARQRKDFNGEFFEHLKLVADSYQDSLQIRDEIAGLAAKCLAAVQAYDNVISDSQALKAAMDKLNYIFDSPSLEEACKKIDDSGTGKQLDSATMMLITKIWTSAKDSQKIKNEAKDIMHHLYTVANQNLQSRIPNEVDIIKSLLSIRDPEERLQMLPSIFSPGDEKQPKDSNNLYTTPRKLLKWLKKIVYAYYNNKRETVIEEAKLFMDPLAIQRLEYLIDVVEEHYI